MEFQLNPRARGELTCIGVDDDECSWTTVVRRSTPASGDATAQSRGVVT